MDFFTIYETFNDFRRRNKDDIRKKIREIINNFYEYIFINYKNEEPF